MVKTGNYVTVVHVRRVGNTWTFFYMLVNLNSPFTKKKKGLIKKIKMELLNFRILLIV